MPDRTKRPQSDERRARRPGLHIKKRRKGGAQARPTPEGGAAPTPPRALVRTVPAAIAREQLIEEARDFMDASISPATRRAYASDWRAFTVWCREHGFESMPATPAVFVLYLTALAGKGKKVATIERARSAISVAHDTRHQLNPSHAAEVKRTLQGIRRTLGSAQVKKKAVLADDIEKMIGAAVAAGGYRGMRDAALLALGFAGGFRRSELAVIRTEHLRFEEEGVAVLIPKSKTDQEGKGRWLGIAHTPTVELLRTWLSGAGLVFFGDDGRMRTADEGPVFRPIHRSGTLSEHALSAEAVAEIVKKYAAAVGFDPKKYAGHSLRRGFITTTIREGKLERDIMRQTGHKSTQTFLGYIEEASVFMNNASGDLWGSSRSKPK